MPEEYEFRPNKAAFLGWGIFRNFVGTGIFLTVLFFLVNVVYDVSFVWFLVAFMFLESFSVVSKFVQYKKTRYVLTKDKIVQFTGGIFSDQETELAVRNITTVNMRLPFLENYFFGTGSVSIQAAGAAGTEVYLASIDSPEQAFDYVLGMMRANGFKLSKRKLIQEESPSSIAALFEVVKNFVVLVAILGFIGWSTLLAISDEFPVDFFLAGVITAVFILYFFVNSIFRYVDLVRRSYKVYNDCLTYSEGFLTTHEAVLPAENIADAEIDQTLIDRIFGLYDVKVSCQGTGQEIRFKNMKNGITLEDNIDKIVAKHRRSPESSKRIARALKKSPKHKKASHTTGSAFVGEYKMSGKRLFMPLVIALPFCIILFPLLFVWGIVALNNVIMMATVKYRIKRESVEEKHDFLSKKVLEFSAPKITGVIFREDIFDKWSGTCSFEFLSIGSSNSIKFKHIEKTPGILEEMQKKFGYHGQDESYRIHSEFSLGRYIMANLGGWALWLFLMLMFFVFSFVSPLMLFVFIPTLLWPVGSFIYKKYYYEKSVMIFYSDYAITQKGIFVEETSLAHFDDIKGVRTTKYPLSDAGALRLDIAGERLVDAGKSKVLLSNHIEVRYADDIEFKDELIDLIVYESPSSKQIKHFEENPHEAKTVLEVSPALANSVAVTVGIVLLVSVFTLGIGLIALPFAVPWAVISTRAKSFAIQNYRVIGKSGVFYKKQVSVVFEKIDHINKSQGMLGKMFKNGNVEVNTTGSSKPELVVSAIPEYHEFYDELKKQY